MTNSGQTADRRTLLQQSLQALEAMEAKLQAVERAKMEPIAVIGMSCRFPGGVDSPESFWELLRNGRDGVSDLPPDRLAIAAAFGVSPESDPDKPAWQGGFLKNIDQFDPQLFGITPREALTMDPQHRLVLEVSWEALERAGYAPDSLTGSRTGVFLGISTNDYGDIVRKQGYDHMDAYAATGGSMNVAAGRVSFTLGLQGPSIAVDTACSSSIVAIHLAVQSLRNRESNLAIAGGVNAVLMPDGFVSFSSWGMMASDGRCKAFDSRADGFVRSEGCGMLVLKRLSDAQADGDHILAVVRGSSVNQDGRSSGLTVPNGRAQQAMLQQALANAGLEPHEVQYVEAHGTGTALGDPIEVEAIGAVLGKGRPVDQKLFLSSVKTNIGHAESAAGIAATIKVILAMQHGEIPPMLHLKERSPKIPWPVFPIETPVTPTPWPAQNGVRIAGVSGFGFSGTNAHVLLASAPEPLQPATEPQERPYHLLTLSTKSEAALTAAAARLAAHLEAHPELDPADVSATLNTGRAQFAHRLAITGAGIEELKERLQSFAIGTTAAGIASGRAQGGQPRVAFLFTGQGAQYAGMGRGLYASEPVFRTAIDQCAELLAPLLDVPLQELLFGSQTALLDQTGYTQPALFSIEYALSELWRSWGVTPSVVIGHSVGEFAAAVVAGVLSLEDGIQLIAARGRLMQSLPAGGAMAAIFAPLARVEEAIAPYAQQLAIAAANGPEHTVISGTADAVEAVMGIFAPADVRVQRLQVSHAFHSPLMEPILKNFEDIAAGVTFRQPRVTLISNLSGERAADEITTPGYWRRHVREAVRFGAGIEALRKEGVDLLIEVGPHPTLLGMAQQIPDSGAPAPGLPSLRRNRDDNQQILESLGQAYVRGVSLNWNKIHQGPHQKLILPTYPFQRARYWVDLPAHNARRAQELGKDDHPLLGRRIQAPLLRETLFEREVLATEPHYLADHVVMGSTVFPGTAYFELALAAAAKTGPAPVQVASMNIREPLMLGEQPTTIQVVLTPEEAGEHSFQIISFDATDPAAVHTHTTGVVRAGDTSAQAGAVDLAALRAACAESIDADTFYANLAERGLDYGPSFRGVRELYRGDNAALGLVQLPEEAGSADGYQFHPALLDACFHVIGAAVSSNDAAVPVSIKGLRLYKPVPTTVWCYVERLRIPGESDNALSSRLLFIDQAGELVAELERLEILRVAPGSWARDPLAPWFHQLAWRTQQRGAATIVPTGNWLVVSDQPAAASTLAEQLMAQGATVALTLPGTHTQEFEPGRWQANLADPAAFDQILAATPQLQGVICLWGENSTGGSLAELSARQEVATAGTLHLVQALSRRSGDLPRLWIATSRTQMVDVGGAVVEPGDAPVWGLGRVVILENPGLQTVLVDLESSNDIAQLIDEVRAPDRENQVALRGGTRYVARLVKRTPAGMALPVGEPYALTLPERGMLDKVAYQPATVREPGPGEVAINVYATGLNFRDVLNVLGMYPGDPGPPGIECAGVITAVGPEVEGLKVGDAVVGLAQRSFDAVVVTKADLVAHKPDNMSFADAATVPSAFLTAYYGLHTLAGLKAGDRVLIHAAAGGVGLAAVQIAQQLGAEVFATAGAAEKHAALRSRGVEHIYSSRTANFRTPIMELSGGHGIDVVLNSLSDDFITDSFALLAPGGRFLEIGKRGIWTQEQATEARPDTTYIPYDLGDVLRDDPKLIKHMLESLLESMASGTLTPLPLRAFPAERAVDSFRYMSQAKHIGKVVVTHRPAAWSGPIAGNGTYLVTGGLGGIGLQVGNWLAERGARHIVLIGRRAPSPEAAAAIEALRENGVTVSVMSADIGLASDVARVLEQIAATGQPLRGVFHAAGVLDDGVLSQQRWERFEKVFAPKVAGAWNLHIATRGLPLDHFVLFSSASALLGNAGQANYAAANAFLDALAHRRQAEGLPATTINWGAWSEVGMAAGLGAHMAGRGVEFIAPAQGVQALERALVNGDSQAAILAIQWPVLLEQFPEGATPALFTELARATPARQSRPAAADEGAAFRQRFAAAQEGERQGLLVERLTQHVARVMGMDVQSITTNQSLSDLGIDSLMAVELKNRIDGDLRGSIPVTTLLAGPSIEELAEELAHQGDQPAIVPVSVVAASNGEASSPEHVLATIDQLSDDDVTALLDEMLKSQGGN